MVSIGGFDHRNIFRVAGNHRACAVAPIFRQLDDTDLAWAWTTLDRQASRQLSKCLGVDAPQTPGPETLAALAHRLAELDGAKPHEAGLLLCGRALAELDAFDVGTDLDTPVEQLAAASQHLPPTITRLCFVLLHEAEAVSDTELSILLGQSAASDGIADPLVTEGGPDGSDTAAEWPGAENLDEPLTPTSVFCALVETPSPIDLLIAHTLHSRPSDLGAGLAAAAARRLTDLDPSAMGAWFVLGYLHRSYPVEADSRPSAGDERARIVGELVARCELDDPDSLHRFCVARWPDVAEAIETDARIRLFGPVARALIVVDPDRASRLLSRPAGPFRGWQFVLTEAKRTACELLAENNVATAEHLLAAVRAQVQHWLTEPGRHRPDDILEHELISARTLLAACRRHRSDFRGALDLLGGDVERLPPSSARATAFEAALAQASLTAPELLRLPSTARELNRLAVRLGGAGEAIAHLLRVAPDDGIARFLAGAAAVAAGNHEAAVVHLAAAEMEVERAWGRQRGAEVRFHRALAELRLLENMTADGAAELLLSALADGYEAGPALLCSALDLLELHESPFMEPLLSAALATHPADAGLHDRLVAALGTAPSRALLDQTLQIAALKRGRARSRLLFPLLRASSALHQHELLEACVDQIEELVDQSGDELLIGQWEHTLATDDALRDITGANQADVARALLLIRIGRERRRSRGPDRRLLQGGVHNRSRHRPLGA